MRSIRVPKSETWPASGRTSPAAILRSTVLPAPLPPMTARVVPSRRSRLTPRRTSFWSKDFRTSRSSTRGPLADSISPEEEEEELSEEEVGHDHRHGHLHHGVGGGAAEAFRPSLRLQAVVAADEGDEPPEDHALAEAAEEILDHHPVRDGVPVEIRIDVTVEDRDEHAAHEADGVGDHGDEGKDDEGGEDAGDDELLDIVDADGPQRIDLLRHLHGAELGRDARGDFAPHQDGGEAG